MSSTLTGWKNDPYMLFCAAKVLDWVYTGEKAGAMVTWPAGSGKTWLILMLAIFLIEYELQDSVTIVCLYDDLLEDY